ncbi:MAG TPA: hypothetical protein VLT88_02425 [Desulfosarcina sp.]|nr:hypothetical protein [Desulfosarcina sp.]
MKLRLPAIVCLAGLLAATARADLTGRWSGNDGGTYYLRQQGSTLVWYGEAAPNHPAWSNVFTGRIREGRIKGRWTDVPKGRRAGSGILELAVEENGTLLRAVDKSADFGATRWLRLPARTSTAGPMQRLLPPSDGDCAGFDPESLMVRRQDGGWKIVGNGRWLFDFGPDRAAAEHALRVIRHYRMDRTCAIGRPEPAFTYMLARGGIPSGPMTGEDCLAFDPQALHVGRIDGRWKIVAGRRGLLDFGENASDARRAMAAIRRHGFTHVCFVGRPRADFTYLRR